MCMCVLLSVSLRHTNTHTHTHTHTGSQNSGRGQPGVTKISGSTNMHWFDRATMGPLIVFSMLPFSNTMTTH